MKNVLFLSALLGLSVACASTPEPTETAPIEQQTSAEKPESTMPAKGLDARLSTYEYPYAVKWFKAEHEGQELEIAYMDESPQTTPKGVVLLLHGKNFSGAYWEKTMAHLLDEGWRVIAPDQVGFGKSAKPTTITYSFELMASITKSLLDELDVKSTSVMGHSMGGMLATRFALSYPETTQKLIMVNPIGLEDWHQKGVPMIPLEDWEANEAKRSPESIKTYMSNAYFDGSWKPEYDSLLDIQAGWATGPDRELMGKIGALTSVMVFTQPVVHDFPKVESPTLLIIGQRDKTAIGKALAPPEIAEKLGNYPELGRAAAAAIPKSTLVEIEGVGHVPQLEAWDVYIRAVDEFLLAD